MNIETDISPEAVERLAKDHDTVGNDPVRYVMGHPHHWNTAKVLRKLSARIEELEAQLAEVTAGLDEVMREALGLAVTLHRKHYSEVPQWEPLDTPAGVISQIDNMVAGIIDRAETYRAAIPVAYQMALEDAAARFDEIAQHDQGGIDYSDLVGIPISNREQLVKSVKDAEMDAKYIRALPTPTAAELMARINEGEKE